MRPVMVYCSVAALVGLGCFLLLGRGSAAPGERLASSLACALVWPLAVLAAAAVCLAKSVSRVLVRVDEMLSDD